MIIYILIGMIIARNESEYIICSYLLQMHKKGHSLNNEEARKAIINGINAYEKFEQNSKETKKMKSDRYPMLT